MKKSIGLISLVAILAIGLSYYWLSSNNRTERERPKQSKLENKSYPFEQFYFQRSYPNEQFDFKAYNRSLDLVKADIERIKQLKSNPTADWTLEGPTYPGGRINSIAIHPSNPNIIYTGASAGGVFKTIDGGANWEAIADDFAYLAVSDIALDPNDPNTVYVATGDHNISGLPHVGDGVYKSTDAGNSWTNIGLTDQAIVSKIIIDPNNSNTLYAATMGKHYIRDNNRGLYKSVDGGANWLQVLFISNQAGVIDIVMDPFDSNTLYAAGWDRIRNNQESTTTGNGGRIYKTTDGGSNWIQLTGGLPQFPVSRTGLAISQKTPGTVYACVVDVSYNLEGIYKTIDAGTTWTALDTNGLDMAYMGGFGWYFAQVRVSPYNDDEISLLGVEMYTTFNGGALWQKSVPDWFTYEVHADDHDLIYVDSTTVLLATDGGLHQNPAMGNVNTWVDLDEVPNMQFYRIAVNPHQPGVYAGGAQDNGTWYGSSANMTWDKVYGGDGFQPIYDPTNPNLMYYETQNGSLYFDDGGGTQWFDWGIDQADRRNWDAPFIMSHHNSATLYTGTYRVYKITGAPSGNWTAMSPDLTDGVIFGNSFHNISSLGESPVDANDVYAGTSDGNVWRSTDAGNNWTNVTTGLPDRYVTSIEGSPDNDNVVFTTHSGYKDGDYLSYIHKSTNNGSNWTNISGDLPQMGCNDICILPGHNDSVIFVANDAGVYATTNGGVNWLRMGSNMPAIPVFDIEIDPVNNKLIAGTFARSIQSYPIDDLGLISSTANLPDLPNLALFPNPARDHLSISGIVGANRVEIYDLNGRLLQSKNPMSSNLQVDISDLAAGNYLVKIGEQSLQFVKQ